MATTIYGDSRFWTRLTDKRKITFDTANVTLSRVLHVKSRKQNRTIKAYYLRTLSVVVEKKRELTLDVQFSRSKDQYDD